jgi:hypothetical protein
VLRCAVEDQAACHLIAAGDDDVCVEEEVGDRSDVGGDQVLVLAARHRLAVKRQFVLHIVHKIIEASFVQNVKVCAVAALKIGVRQCLDLLSVCRLRANERLYGSWGLPPETGRAVSGIVQLSAE